MKKAIIVTHPSGKFQVCLYGLDYEYLIKLAELRSKNKGTIKARIKTITYESDFELSKKTDGITKYKIDREQYRAEIEMYFNLR